MQERLSHLADVPMMIAWGMKDFVFDRHFLDEWSRRFPKAEVHRFPKAGHYVLEDEADSIVPIMQRFLAAHPERRRAVETTKRRKGIEREGFAKGRGSLPIQEYSPDPSRRMLASTRCRIAIDGI